MGGSTTTTQKSTTAPAPEAMKYYKELMQRLQDVGKLAYTPYEGQRVAEFTPYQQMAMQSLEGLQGAGMGTLQEALEAGRRGTAPVTTADIQRYQDPYQQMVIDAMSAKMRQQEAEDISKLQGQSISSGAYGGDRAKLAQAQLMRNQEQERNARIADLMSKGYTQSLGAAQADREAAARGAQNLSALATQQYTQPKSWVSDLYGMGAAQQALEQQKLNIPYETYKEQRAYPFELTQYLTGLGTALGSQMGGTSSGSTTQPKPSMWSQLGGLGLGLAFAPMTGGASLFGAAASNALPGVFKPSATGGRIEKEDGGGLTKTAMFHEGYIPSLNPVKGQGAPGFSAPSPAEQKSGASDMIEQAMSLAKRIKTSNDPTDPASWQTTTTLSPENPASWATSVSQPGLGFAYGGGIRQHFSTGGGVNPIDADPRIASLLSNYNVNPNDQPPIPFEDPTDPSTWKTTTEVTPPSNLMDYSIMANRMLEDKKPPTQTSATESKLPEIIVPEGGEGAKKSGISKPYEEGKEGAVKGSSLLGSLLGFSPEAEQALMMAGFSTAAGQSSSPLTNIGAGGMSGMKYYNDLVKAKQEQALKEKEIAAKTGRENLVRTSSVTEKGEPVFINKNTGESVDIRGNAIGPDTVVLNEKEYLAKKKSEAKEEADFPKAQARFSTQVYENQRTKDDLKKAKEKIGYLTTGFLGVPLSKIPGTDAANLAEDIKSIQARLGFEQLQTMRQNSPTGGALGNVSNQEIAYLQAAVQSLSTNQSPDQLREKFDEIATHLSRIEDLQKQGFAQQYGEDKLFETLPTTGGINEPPKISSKEEFDKVPSGTVFFNTKTNRLEKK